jgi:hypothetical protein
VTVETVYVPAGKNWTTRQIEAWYRALNDLASDYGWDGEFKVVPAGIPVTTWLGTDTKPHDV